MKAKAAILNWAETGDEEAFPSKPSSQCVSESKRKFTCAGGRQGTQQSEIENRQPGIRYKGETVLWFGGEMSSQAHVFEHLGKADGAGAQLWPFQDAEPRWRKWVPGVGLEAWLPGLTSCPLSASWLCVRFYHLLHTPAFMDSLIRWMLSSHFEPDKQFFP